MNISEKGIALIKRFESFRSKPYKDVAGVWTIGYGHTRTASCISLPISEQQAHELLISDIYIIERQLKPALKDVVLTQHQYDAIVSFCFNLGLGAFRESNAYHIMLTDPDSKSIADSWVTFRNAGGKYYRGLLLRRLQELIMYYGG